MVQQCLSKRECVKGKKDRKITEICQKCSYLRGSENESKHKKSKQKRKGIVRRRKEKIISEKEMKPRTYKMTTSVSISLKIVDLFIKYPNFKLSTWINDTLNEEEIKKYLEGEDAKEN